MSDRVMNKERQDKERKAAEDRQAASKGVLYTLLPNRKDPQGKKVNRYLVMKFKPALLIPEIFGNMPGMDEWDYKAVIAGHYLKDENGDTTYIFCPYATALYYNKFDSRVKVPEKCDFCQKDVQYKRRAVFVVFDYDKLIGTRPLNRNEDHPQIQCLVGPEGIYNDLDSEFQLNRDFTDGQRVVRTTKDTTKGYEHTEYKTQVEDGDVIEITQNPDLKAYLLDESNYINPVKHGLIAMSSATSAEAPAEQPPQQVKVPPREAAPAQAPAQQPAGGAGGGYPPAQAPAPAQTPAGAPATAAPAGRHINWRTPK